jgi:thioredoxin-dependent peroxiredoxin
MTTSRMIRTLLGLAVAVALLVVVAGAAEAPTAGTKAPDFTLKSQEGNTVSLHDFKGKWVVLYFYPKDFTQGCTIEAHNFQADQDQYTKMNAAIVGVSVDSVDSHQQFCTKENLTFKLLSDEKHQVVNMYGSTQKFGDTEVAARNTFLVDPQGKIEKVFLKVNPTPHSKEVLAALAELEHK